MTVARTTQAVAEVLVEPVPKARVSQAVAEVVIQFSPALHVTQVVAEVLIPSPVTPSARRRPIYIITA